jgi:flagellar biosynthetic protein FliO
MTLLKFIPLLALLLLDVFAAPAAYALTDAEFAELNRDAATASPTPAGGAVGAPAAKATGAAMQPPSLGGMLARLGLALGVVFALMAGGLWAVKKFFPKSGLATRGGAIEILATRPLGQRRSLVLVRAQGKTVLLGVAPQQINMLTEIEAEADWAATEAAATAAAAAELTTPRAPFRAPGEGA